MLRILALILVLICCPAGLAQQDGAPRSPARKELRVGYGISSQVSPIVSLDESGEPCGYLIELLKELGREAGYSVTFHRYDPDTVTTAVRALASGEVNVWAQVRMNIGDKDPAGLLSGPPAVVSPGVLVMRKDAQPISSIDELRTRRVACTREGPTEVWLMERQISPTASLDGFANVLRSVKDGDADCAVASMLAASTWIDHLGLRDELKYQTLQTDGFGRVFTYATRPDDTETTEALEKAFQRLRNSGAASDLYGHYIAAHHADAISELLPKQRGELPHRALISELRVGVQLGILPEELLFRRPDGEYQGYIVDLTNEIGRLYGVPVRYVCELGYNLRNDLDLGKIDVLAIDYAGEPHPTPNETTRPYLTFHGMLYLPKDARPPTLIADLHLFRMAVAAGSPSQRYLERLRVPRIIATPTTERAFELLRRGEVDGVVTPEIIGRAVARQGSLDGIVGHSLPGAGYAIDCGFGVAGENVALLWDLEDAMTHMQESGFTARARERWLSELIPQPPSALLTARHGIWAMSILGVTLLVAGAWFWSLRRELDRRTSLIREAELRFRQIFDTSLDAMMIVRIDDRTVIAANRLAQERFGADHHDLVGRELRSLGGGVCNDADALRTATESGLAERFAVPHTRADGRASLLDLSIAAVNMGGERVLLIVCRDVTAKAESDRRERELEQRLQHSQRLESIGRLAGGVAHDFNNLLVAIMGNTALAAQTLGPGEAAAAEHLDTVMLAARSGADLTRQMLAYAGRSSSVPQPTDLSELVRSVHRMMEVILEKNTRLIVELGADLPAVLADRTQISQLVMNLLANASDAMAGRAGVVSVRTCTRDIDRSTILPQFAAESFPGGRTVCLEVSDTGCGMTPDVLERMFEPFFSTKFPGRGLGLSAALGTLKAHSGAISVSSVPGEGTTVRVYFPPAPSAPHPADGAPVIAELKPAPAPARRGRALVVDDEPMVREVTRALLAREGYDVLALGSGEEAIARLRDPGEAYDFMVLDLTMPGIGGPEALREVSRLRPHLPVVLMSGNLLDAPRDLPERAAFATLEKPFTLESLRRAIDAARAAPAP